MMMGNRKKIKEYAQFYHSFLEKAQRPARIEKQQFWRKKAKSVPVFEPGLHRQNAISLPLVPPQLPSAQVDILFIVLKLHLSQVQKCQPIHLTHAQILWIQITTERVESNGNSPMKKPRWIKVLNLQPSDHIYFVKPLYTFITGFGYFHGSTQSGPIQVASTMGDHLQQMPASWQSKLSRRLRALKELCCPSAWLTCFCNRARLFSLSLASA